MSRWGGAAHNPMKPTQRHQVNEISHQSTNQPTNQPTNQSFNQPISQRTSSSRTAMVMTSERVGTMRCSFSSLHSVRVTFLMSPKSIR